VRSNEDPERRLDGRVAVVTGAGRGLGRAHALALAAMGASVLVNDLGSDLRGRGANRGEADAVVAEISACGGTAKADHHDVASIGGGRAVVEAAIGAFERVDIVVNNAGFADGSGTIEQPIEPELDAQLNVHLRAALGSMSAAFPGMRERGYGRIINTVSEVALDARFAGPLAYGAAKAALWSATLAAAAQGQPHGITVNAISPAARTRINAELLDEGFRDGASKGLDLAPGHVAAVVAYLASPAAADITGRVLHVAGGAIREYQTRRNEATDLVARLISVTKDADRRSGD
jgi:NAD(P)-dependent dehydrogenase (short-subunit alcohol dehydrogenase family)